MRARRVQAHLEILIVHRHLMERKLHVGKNREIARPSRFIGQRDIDDFNLIIHCDRKLLLCPDP